MIEPISIATIAATVSAMIDVIRFGKDAYEEFYARRTKDPSLPSKVDALERAFSTYSAEEVEAIYGRIANCRKRFIEEGAGAARKNCLCSVLSDVREGNGGSIPDPEWEGMYNQLGCEA